MFRIWWQKFFSFPRSRFARRRGYRPPHQLLGRTTRLSMTALEDRVTPAFNLTLSSIATVGVSSSTVAGVTTFTATATGANLNVSDIAGQLIAGNSVIVTSGSAGTEAGNITANTGLGVANAANTSVTIQSGTGPNLVGDIIGANFQLNASGSSVTIHAHHDVQNGFAAQGTTAGQLASASIIADTGGITGFSGISAVNAVFQAATGIGSAGTPTFDHITNLVAQTGTGGIFIGNNSQNGQAGPLNIGFAGDPFQGLTVTGASGGITVTTVNGLTVNEAVAAPDSVTLTADDMAINAQVNAGTGIVTLQPKTAGRAIDLGLGAFAGELGLSNAELDRITAGILRIGNTSSGPIQFTAPIATHPGYNTLALTTGNSLFGSSGGNTISVTNLAVRANGSFALETVVTNLAIRNTGSGSIIIQNTGPLTIAAVDTLDGSAGNEQINSAAPGQDTTFEALGAITFAANFTAAGSISVDNTVIGAATNENITVNSGVVVESTGSDIQFEAANDIVINANGTVKADTGNINFRTGFNNSGGEGIMTLNGTVSAAGAVVLNVEGTNAAQPPGTNGVTEAATGSIVANRLLLLGLADSRPFVMNASTANAVGTIAASTDDSISFRNSGALTVGTVSSPFVNSTGSGIVTGNHDVTLQASGQLTVDQAVNAGTATATLTSTGAALSQTATVAGAGVIGGTINLAAATGISGSGGFFRVQAGTLNATSTTADINLRQVAGGTVAVGQIKAAAGNVNLGSTVGPIVSVAPNDNVPEVIGNTVTLDTSTAPSNGNTGQIGFFTTSAQFFEVDANVLTALTNNSRLWVRDVGTGANAGVAIAQVNAGNNTAFLQVANGNLTSATVDGNPDVLAATVNLRALNGGNIGGSAASPLEISATNLNAAVQNAAGGIHVLDTTGGINVVLAQTVNGPIDLTAAGAVANLTTTAAAGTAISAPGNTVTLNATGAIVSGTPAGVIDVAATNLAATAGAGIGSNANPLKTAITNLAFSNAGADVVVTNTGALTINAVSALTTSSNTGVATTLTAASPLTFAVNTTSAGTLTATATETNDPGTFADKLTVNAGVTVQSTGGNVILQAGDDIILGAGSLVQSNAGFVTLTAAFGDLDNEGSISMGSGTVQAGTNITLSARDDITVSTLTANAATGAVSITSTSGNIFDDGNNATVITGNTLSMSAVRSIGQPGATAMMDTTVNSLSTATTGAGPFVGAPTPGTWVTNTGDLTITSATTGDGVILIDASGNLNAQSVTANGTGRNVRLRALGGNLTVGVVTALADIVALSATGAILDGNGAANNVTALSLSLSAGTGIATAADPLETTVSNVAWSAGTGGIFLANTGGLTVTSVTAFGATVTGGAGAGAATISAAGPLTVASNIIMGGTIALATTETATEIGTPLPPPDDDLTVNAGVTVESTGGNVIFTSGDSIVLQAGSLVKSDAGSVTLTAGVGDDDNDAALILGGPVQGGTDITIVSPGDICVGTLTAAGTVSITSTTGAILDCNDPPTGTLNITASKLALSAVTGIGVTSITPPIGAADAPLETQVSNLEAQTQTGGIFIVNGVASPITLTIGGVTAALTGVRATTSGDISITNAGSVLVNQSGENVVAQSGNVSIIANGAAADILTGGADATPAGAVRTVASGNIALTAGQDVLIGDPANIAFGNVRAFGGVTINAGRDLVVDVDSFLESGTGGGAGDINANAGRNISLLHNVFPGAHIRAIGTGAINLTTGANGVFTADAAGGTGVSTAGGDITITADNMNIVATPINAGAGVVRLQQVSNGQAIDVGGADAAGILGLTNAELGNVTARVLVIGRNDPSFFGPITVSAPIALAAANVPTLVLRGGGSITETVAGTLTVNNLAVQGNGFIALSSDNHVGVLAGRNLAANAQFGFTEAPNTLLTIGTVDIADPIGFPTGLAGIVTQNGNIFITSDNLNITTAVGAGTGCVFLQQRTPTNTVDLGGADAAGVLGLTNTEMNFITAAGVQVGSFGGAAVTITAPITLSTAAAPPAVGTNALELVSSSAITETGAGTLSVNQLTVAAGAPVSLAGANDLRFLAGGSANGGFVVTNAPSAGNPTGKLIVTNLTVCGNTFPGVVATGDVTITADDLDILAPINAAGFCVTLQPFSAGQNVTVGTEPGGTLGLTNAELNQVTARVLRVGRNDAGFTGTLTVTSGIAPTGTNDLVLLAGGAISEAAGGTVTVANLAAQGNSTVDLTNTNAVNTLAGQSNGAFRFVNGGTFTVGTVDVCTTLLNGITTNGGDATLVSNTGAIQLQQFVNAAAGTARLQAATGVASTAATGTVTAARLGVRNTTSGDILLDQANTVGVLAAINGAAGAGINVRTTGALALDTVSADGALFAGLNNVTTTGAGGTVRLQAAGLSQTANGIVSSDLLGIQNTAGDVILDQPNAVNTFAAANSAAGGRVTLRDANSLILGTVGAQGTFAAVNGVTTNAGTTYLQAAGNVTQTAVGLVNSQALAVGSSAGGTIRLDQGNTVATFAANDTVAAGLVNFRTTGALTLDTVTSGSGLLAPIAGVTTNAGKALLHASGGIGQTATGLVNSATLAVRNDTAGNVTLMQTNYGTNVGNQVGTFAAANSAAGGRVDLATLGALTLGTVTGDGTFAQVRGLTTNNGGSNLRTGTDFSAVDLNFASPFITLGSGNFLLNPGQTPVPAAQLNTVVRNVTLNAEVQTTGTFRLGVPKLTDAPPPPPPATVPDQSPVPPNPTGAATVPPAPDNPFRETFNVRPSANVQILINGNDPTVAPGDTLNLILTDLPPNASIQFTPGGVGSGRFDFPNTRKAVPFTGIETVGGLNVLAASTQTGPNTYTITASGTIQGRKLGGGITGGSAPANPFIVSPNPVNPTAPFGAARITFGDFNGDGVTDLILGNGPANAPLVTVVNGRSLFGAQHALTTSDILSPFFAYNQTFQGGLFVAAGDFNGDGKAEIVTGADQGGGPHVKVFSFNPAGADIYHNVVDFATTFANPANSPFPNGGFYAYDQGFRGGVRVAVGDVNGDGALDIITGAGPGGGPHVKVFSGAGGGVIRSFYAYAANFTGGVYVAAGDYDKVLNGVLPGKGTADILTGAGAGGPHVRVFSGANLALLTQFFAFGPDGSTSLFGTDLGVSTGVGSVAFADVNGDGKPDIIVGSNRGPRTRIAAFLGNTVNPPPRFHFTTATNPNPALFTVDPTTGDLITLPGFGFRDGSNVAGLFGNQ
jgi:fibronectin-binding autotransporter adhesin